MQSAISYDIVSKQVDQTGSFLNFMFDDSQKYDWSECLYYNEYKIQSVTW